MAQKVADVEVKSLYALMMHQYPLIPIEALDKKTPEEQAEYAAYRDPDTKRLYIPGAAMQRALVAAATYSKGKGRATLEKPVAACVLVTPERLDLGVSEYKIDARAVVIGATKGRIVRYRPRIEEWGCKFSVEFDDTLLTEAQVRRVVDDAGQRVGLLEYRPAKKGPFGRFMVTAWKVS